MTEHDIDPGHYQTGSMEVIDAIEGLGLRVHESHALKYLARWRHKHNDPDRPDELTVGMVADLKKARWWIDRLIVFARRQHATNSTDDTSRG